MSQMEELLRAAARESGAEVSPGQIRPLDLSGVPFDRPWLRGRGRRRWAPRRGWARVVRPGILVPVLAALAVVAVVAASLALPRILSSRGGPATPSLTVPAGVPPYYVSLSAAGTPASDHPANVTVRDTWTGRPLATVTPPPGFGTFSVVAGGAVDDRTWVVAAEPWHPLRAGTYPTNVGRPVTLFRLTFEPASRVIRLRRLPGITATAPFGLPGAGTARPITAGLLRGVALSPDGSRVAVAVTEGSAQKVLVRVIPLAPGARGGTWVLPGGLASLASGWLSLSWTADNRVLFLPVWKELIFLDTTKPTGDMLAASRVIPYAGYSGKAATGITYACFPYPFIMSLDGTTLTCGGSPSTDYGDKNQAVGIVTVSARTGVPRGFTPIQRYNAWVSGHYAMLYWASPAGARTYIAMPYYLRGPQRTASLSVWQGGKVAGTIPLPADVADAYYPFNARLNSVAW